MLIPMAQIGLGLKTKHVSLIGIDIDHHGNQGRAGGYGSDKKNIVT